MLKVTNTCREVVVGVRTLSLLTDCNMKILLKKVVTMRVIRAGKAVLGTQYEPMLKITSKIMGTYTLYTKYRIDLEKWKVSVGNSYTFLSTTLD